MKSILEYKTALTFVGATMTAISGACWGYVFASNEMEAQIDDRVKEILDVEVDKVRRFYATRYKDFGPEELSTLSDDDIEGGKANVVPSNTQIVIPADALTTPEGRAAVMAGVRDLVEPEPEPIVEVNSWEESPRYDEEALIAQRSPDAPYVISTAEFAKNENDYEEYKLTWFEKDGVLMGEDEDLIPDSDTVVGDKNLQRFGMMSGNNNIVYIQNDSSRCIFVVNRQMTSASEFLYGGEDGNPDVVISHSGMNSRRSRRDSDN